VDGKRGYRNDGRNKKMDTCSTYTGNKWIFDMISHMSSEELDAAWDRIFINEPKTFDRSRVLNAIGDELHRRNIQSPRCFAKGQKS